MSSARIASQRVRLSKMALVSENPWFWDVSRAEAEAMVAARSPGSFVVRPSSKAGAYAITFRARDDGSINHTLVFERDGRGFQLEGQQLVRRDVWRKCAFCARRPFFFCVCLLSCAFAFAKSSFSLPKHTLLLTNCKS